jgi:hypothetical protein
VSGADLDVTLSLTPRQRAVLRAVVHEAFVRIEDSRYRTFRLPLFASKAEVTRQLRRLDGKLAPPEPPKRRPGAKA